MRQGDPICPEPKVLKLAKVIMWRNLAAFIFIAGGTCLATGPAIAADLTGVWLTANGESEIEIGSCEDAFCGKILQILKPHNGQDGPSTDVNNPDPSLRDQPILGLTILTGLKPSGDADEWKGTVYNPDDGKNYDVTLTLKHDGDVLKVKGCLAYILCDSQKWTRVPSTSLGLY